MSLAKIVVSMIIFFSLPYSSKPSATTDCTWAEVVGYGPYTFEDLVSKLAVNFAQNRSAENNMHSNVQYHLSTVLDSKAAMMASFDDPPIFMMSLFLSSSVTDNVKYPEIKTFPVCASAVVIIFNLPRIDDIILSMDVLTQIYLGEITYWNDTKIQQLNKGLKLPSVTILPVASGDENGGTYIFTDSLSNTNSTWKQKYGRFSSPNFVNGVCCNSTSWPPNVVQYYGWTITGVVGIILSIPYTIGYVSLPSAVKNNVNYAYLVNDAGKVTSPSTETVQAAMDYFLLANGGGYGFTLNNAKTDDAYPLASFVYVTANISGRINSTCCEMREFVAFLDWLLFTVNSSIVASFGMTKLSKLMALEIQRNILQSVTCQGESMYDAYLQSFLILKVKLPTYIVVVIAVSTVVVVGLIFLMTVYVLHLKSQQKFQEMEWFIPFGMITLSDARGELPSETIETDRTSTRTPYSSSEGNTNDGEVEQVKHTMIIATYKDNKVCLDKLERLPSPAAWKNKSKEYMVKMIQDVMHRNVLTLRGATILEADSYAVFDACNKGTLHYVLQTCKYELTEAVKFNLAMDVIEGLKFLQLKNLQPTAINSLTCMVESSWTVKVGQWHRETLYDFEGIPKSKRIVKYEKDDLLDLSNIIELVYLDWETYPSRLPASDIYSVGMLILEIYTKKLPYTREIEIGLLSYPAIFQMKFIDKAFNVIPEMDEVSINKDVKEVIRSCLVNYNGRPLLRQLGTMLKSTNPNDKGMVDAMMGIIETHADKLEEKTVQLQDLTERMEGILHEVLPPQIATKLFQGEVVPPEYFEYATICFSDIVGFTVISAKSSPQEVMTFLNDLWVAFDAIIQKFDVYKVDTIGDAYMVCSGLPIKNGSKHVKNIASFSLALLEECNNFRIFHIPGEKVEIRIGINTGPVIAGIVGSKMPQYCVFGDAVNTASRMQATSLPMKIQISENTFNLLKTNYNEFECQIRGEIEVKV